ncbi:MAG: hypothetical protein KBC15_00160 [Candidatus Levybacteria bacterium]|nr:hypothetical protein [Candidatus Levybacteria bacterium]
MDTNALSQIRDLIARSNRVAIVVSANPSVDQMAGALAISLSMNAQGKKTYVISPTAALVEHSSLVGIDRVKGADEGGNGDLVVSFPYREGEIDKVSYTIEGDALNIVVKAGEKGLTFQESDVQFKRGADKPDMIISVGVGSISQLSSMFSEEILNAVTLLNIDNVSTNEGYGNVVLVSAKFSSLSEQVADLLLNLEMELDVDVSQNLMIGLTDATNNFQDPKTSYLAFEIASILIKRGAVRKATSVRPQQATPRLDRADELPRPSQRPNQSSPVRTGSNQPRQDNSHRSSQNQNQNQQPRTEDRRENVREALRQHVNRNSGQQQQQSQPQNSQPSMEPASESAPVLVPDLASDNNQPKPPSDWLTPKVYKGSTSVS